MHRIRYLDKYPKALLILLVAMAVVFAAVYAVAISQVGYLYNDKILVPGTEGSNTVYTAMVRGEQWRFTVTPDKTVTFRCGDKQYGPYTVKEDPTAIPKKDDLADHMTGVEVHCGDELLFRGGIFDAGSHWIMVNEDGTGANIIVSAVLSDGTRVDSNGQPFDPMKPSVSTILRLAKGPELTHKGHWSFYILGLFLSLVAAVNILFVDELFRLRFIFQARDPDLIEPSDLALGMRPIAWTLMTLVPLISYLIGLK